MILRTDRAVSLNKPRYANDVAVRLADLAGAQGNERLYHPKTSNICKITRLTQEPDLNLVHQHLKALRAKLAPEEALFESAAARKATSQSCALYFQNRRSHPYVR